MRLIIVSGQSGSGKTVALHVLEDLGFYCVDNMPAALLEGLVTQLLETGDRIYEKLAVGIDARNRPADLGALPGQIRRLRERGVDCDVVVLRAEDDILLKRYSETRRRHPLAEKGMSLPETIAHEREVLEPIVDSASIVVDTTRTSVYELRDTIRERIGARRPDELSILIQSFGFKHGLPPGADYVFDLRCLPNPYWEMQLRPLTGRDAAVIEYLDASADARRMYEDILQFLEKWIPEYDATNRSYLTVGLGCTGGQHRSVYMAEKLAARLSETHAQVLTRHSEL